MRSPSFLWTAWAAAAAGLLAVAGCDDADGTGTALASAEATAADSAITTTINVELARDGVLDPTKIDVATAQGRVVLRGSAPDAAARERALRIALTVSGVHRVDNHLTVEGGKS